MKLDVNELAEYLANTPFRVEGVYRYAKIRVPCAESTDSFPDLYFHLQGRRNFNLMVRRIPFPVKSYTWGCKMTLAHKMLGEINWEYILVLYRISNSEREDSGFTHQHFELLTGQSPRLVELLMRLWDVYNQRGGISMFQTEMLFREALNEALLSVVNRENNYESHTLFERISSYVRKYYYKDITIHTLTEQNNVNRNRLSYVFRKHAGMGPAEYLLNYRIKMAQKCYVQVVCLYNKLRRLLESQTLLF